VTAHFFSKDFDIDLMFASVPWQSLQEKKSKEGVRKGMKKIRSTFPFS